MNNTYIISVAKTVDILKAHNIPYYISLYRVIACEVYGDSKDDQWTDVTDMSYKKLAIWLGY